MSNEQPPQDENHVIAERRAKLKSLREAGPAYPNDFTRHHLAADLLEKYAHSDAEALENGFNHIQPPVPGCAVGAQSGPPRPLTATGP